MILAALSLAQAARNSSQVQRPLAGGVTPAVVNMVLLYITSIPIRYIGAPHSLPLYMFSLVFSQLDISAGGHIVADRSHCILPDEAQHRAGGPLRGNIGAALGGYGGLEGADQGVRGLRNDVDRDIGFDLLVGCHRFGHPGIRAGGI